MVKFRFNLVLIFFIFLLPSVASEIEINASATEINYGAPGIAFVGAGQNVTFNSTGTENAESVLWDFGRDISGPNTRYSNLTSVSHIIYAEGRYDLIFTAFYDNDYYEIREYTLFVDYEEKESNIVNNEALFFAIAGSELIMSLVLGYWTQQIRKDKIYLWRLLIATNEVTMSATNIDKEGKPASSSGALGAPPSSELSSESSTPT